MFLTSKFLPILRALVKLTDRLTDTGAREAIPPSSESESSATMATCLRDLVDLKSMISPISLAPIFIFRKIIYNLILFRLTPTLAGLDIACACEWSL